VHYAPALIRMDLDRTKIGVHTRQPGSVRPPGCVFRRNLTYTGAGSEARIAPYIAAIHIISDPE